MHQKIVAGTIFKVSPSIRKVEELVELDSQEQEKWNSLRQDSKGIYQQEDAAKLASMATMVTQNKPSEGFRRVGLARMNAQMDGPTPFQASKWF